MKKQVTFAETKFHSKVNRKQDGIISKSAGSHYPSRALVSVNLGNGSRTQRAPAAGQTSKNRNIKTIPIPKIMASAPFLENSELTPGQRRYLYTVADAYSTEHVRKLIQQHYMNVLHRCIRTGHAVQDNLVNLQVELFPYENYEEEKHSPLTAVNRSKNRGHKSTRSSGKTILPKIPNQYLMTSSDTLTSKKKSKKRTRVITWKRPRPRIPEPKLWDDDDLDFDLDDDSLSECMSLLSMEGGGGRSMTTPISLPDI